MKKFRLPIILTIIIVLAAFAISRLDREEYSAVGSLVGGFGSVLAVIWFFTSLQYQARQLEEQRGQFLTEFQHIREDSRRNALILAKDILNDTEKRALAQNPDLKSITDLMTLCIQFSELKLVLEGNDPSIVQQHALTWLKKETPALTLLNGIKNAAETYFRAVGISNIDYSKDAEEFIYIYGAHLWKAPFFQTYQGSATMLANIMMRLRPGRNAVYLALIVNVDMLIPTKNMVKDDKIIEEIENHKAKGYPLPRIAKIYLEK